MGKLIIECRENGVWMYHETERHHKKVEPQRKRDGLVRRDWDSLAEECEVQAGEYMVVPIVEVEE